MILVAPGLYQADKNACMFFLKHEIAHIKNNDTWKIPLLTTISAIASALFGIAYLSPWQGFLLSTIIPAIGRIALTRRCEDTADDFAIKHSSIEELNGARRFFICLRAASHDSKKTDFEHSLIRDRIKKIEKALRERHGEMQPVNYNLFRDCIDRFKLASKKLNQQQLSY